jgi:2-iminobutanoate/2-iminopropanoate deaminase
MLGTTASEKTVQAQTAESLARIGRTLQAAGFDWSHVVDAIVYLREMPAFNDMNAAYRTVIARDFPARATVGVDLTSDDARVEIMVTAVK